MRAELRDSLEFLYADSKISRVPRSHLAIDVAHGGTAAIHLLATNLKPGTRLDVHVAERNRPFGGSRLFRLVSVPVEVNTGLIGFAEDTDMGDRGPNAPNPFVARRAPFRVFDAMQPVEATLRVGKATEALRLHIPIDSDCSRGTREFAVSVSAAGSTTRLNLTLRVHGACIPPSGPKSIPYTNWFSLTNMAAFHGVPPWSARHWALIRNYAQLMARGRQTLFLVQLRDIFRGGRSNPELDTFRLRRIVATFTRAGLYYIEGGHVACRQPGTGFNCERFVTGLGGVQATAPEGNAELARVAGQLMGEIARNGWRCRWLQHVADEPCRSNAGDYRILCGMVRRHMPGLPLIEATCDRSLPGALDIVCPQVHELHAHAEEYGALARTGDRVWFYTCCEPGGRWLNRLLDQELLRPVLLGWAVVHYGAEGFLHWGLNSWQTRRDPFSHTVHHTDGSWPNTLPAGDMHVVYPGRNGSWSSVRFEAQREGLEDAELLRILRADNPRKAAAIMRLALRSARDYTKEAAVFRRARRTLLAAFA